MSTFPFTASWWECGCGARWPKRDGIYAFADPVEYLTCLAPDCDLGPGEYREGKSPEGRSTCYWLWRCPSCDGWCSWKDDFCHNPDCGRPWLSGAPEPQRRKGQKPTVYPNEHEPLSPEEIEEEQEKRKKGQKHKPIPGCPEACTVRHEFALELESPKLAGCVKEPYAVWAQLDPMLDPGQGPKGSLRWQVVDGQEVARFEGGASSQEGSGLDTEVALEALAPDGESKFPGGGVTVQAVFNFGGKADVDVVARKRIAFHEGVTADCPTACPEITDVEVDLQVVDFDLGARDLTEETLLCPGEAVELAAVLTPEVSGAELTWTLTDAEGQPLAESDARFLGGGLFSSDTRYTCEAGERARLEHGPGTWTGPHSEVPLGGGAFSSGGLIFYELEPVYVQVEVETGSGTVVERGKLQWHGVQLVVQGSWNDAPGGGVRGGGDAQLRTVRTGGPDDGTYVSCQYGHAVTLASCAGQDHVYAWHGRVTQFEGSPQGDCRKASNCLKGRWGAGFCQAHAQPNRWWKYRAETEGTHKQWFKRVAEFKGPRPLWDAHEGVERPWYDRPVVLESRQSTATNSGWSAPEGERNGDSPMAFAPWLAEPGPDDYYLEQVTVQDQFQTFLAVGLYDVDQRAWREFHEVATLSWRVDLVADVSLPASADDGSAPARTAPLQPGALDYRPADLLGKPRSNAAETFGEYLCGDEPTSGAPVPQEAPGVQVLDVHLAGGGKASAGHTPELTLDEQQLFCFAPGFDTVELRYRLEDSDGVRPEARLELRRRGEGELLWGRELTSAERAPGDNVIEWDGKLEGASPYTFPSGYVTLEHSPYELRVVYPGSTAPSPYAWTHFEVRAAGVEVSLLPRKAVDDTRLWDQVFDQGLLTDGEVRRLTLDTNMFDRDMRKYEDGLHDDLKARYGDGRTLPLMATLKLQSCRDDMGAVSAPRGVGRTRFLWDVGWFQDPDPRADASRYSEDVTTGGSAALLVDRVTAFEETAPPGGRACPVGAGGKRGEGGARVLLAPQSGYPARDEAAPRRFPFKCEVPSRRRWAAISHSWESGAFAGQSGVIFSPSRMAGDAYEITVHHVPDDARLAELDTTGPLSGGVQASRRFVVWHRVRVSEYQRKTSGVQAFDWSELRRHFGYAYLSVGLSSASGELMDPEEYNERVANGVDELSAAERCAVADVDHYLAGDMAVALRSHGDYKTALAAAMETTEDLIEYTSAYASPVEYPDLCYDVALKVVTAGWSDFLTKPGLAVLQWNRSNTISPSLLGQAPSDFPSGSASRAVLLMFDDRHATGEAVDTAAHEVGHHLFLPHAKPCSAKPSERHHDTSDSFCMMSYLASKDVHFCGVCLLRLRGWQTDWIKAHA